MDLGENVGNEKQINFFQRQSGRILEGKTAKWRLGCWLFLATDFPSKSLCIISGRLQYKLFALVNGKFFKQCEAVAAFKLWYLEQKKKKNEI